jgi:hypothetical protein
MPSSDGTAAQNDRAHINKDWVVDRRLIEAAETREVRTVTANGITTGIRSPCPGSG